MMQEPVYDEEEQIIDELYPNPDDMTYEELLDLQNKMGYVNKGLTVEQINVTLFDLFIENTISCLFQKL
jgi:hypothetical protein